MLWRVTRDPVYREWGWLMFRAWEKFSRVSTGGFTCLDSVLQVCMRWHMPSRLPSVAGQVINASDLRPTVAGKQRVI